MKHTRRQFIATAGAASAGLVLNGMSLPKIENPQKKYALEVYATKWGFKGSIDAFCKAVKKEGYDGIEAWFPSTIQRREALLEALDKYDLKYGAIANTTGSTSAEHLDSYKNNLNTIITNHKPRFINCHSGKEYFTFEDSKKIIDLGIAISKSSSVPIYHETHRGRILYTAHVAAQFIDKIPELQLTLDISHWCTVSESLLNNQKEAVEKALMRTSHIHSRIGHKEGPQITEPRAPEWQKEVQAHYAWWDKVVLHKKKNHELLTVTTEFGPANYMWTTPYTKQPLSNQWEINVHMLQEFKKRYS